MRYAGVVAIMFLVAAGCSDSKRKLPVGGVCDSSEECADGLCLSGVCLDPEADEDEDGLVNRIEGSLGTDPFSADSDGDGVDDPDELEPNLSARDGDGDGKPDAIESSQEDADEDCLPDESDPDDDGPNHDDPRSIALVVEHCPQAIGACGADGATLAVTCRSGLTNPICSFGAVPGWEEVEAACDGVDNDCDGDTDEPAACETDPLRQALVGHWPLDGDGQDAGPHGDHGVVHGASPAPDRFGVANKALRFTATGDRVSVAATHHPLGEVTVTYTAWVRPDPDFGAATGIMAFGEALAPQRRSSLVTWGARSCLEYAGEQNDFGSGTACTPDRHWSFVAAVKSGRAVKLYLNGRLQGEGQLQAGQDLTSTALQIGLSKWSEGGEVYEQFRGVIDDVRAWSRALTDTELATLYREGGWADVGTEGNPAASCLHVRDGGVSTGDGSYWLDPAGTGAGGQAWCDMTTDGGGWTLVWSYGFADGANFGNVTNAVTPVPSWRGSNIDVPVSTTPPASPTTPGAIDWAAWPVFGEEVLVRADFVDTIACRPAGPQSGSLARGLTGQIDCRVIEDRTTTCDGTLPTWLGWHATGPMFVASSLFLYFDGALDVNWPTHDPCGTNVPPAVGAATMGGAVYLRPTDAPIHFPTTCRWVPQMDRGRTEHMIDPDGPGGRAPFMATCDFVTERGGWTKLSPALRQAGIDRGNEPRELLFKKGGAWYRTPVTKELWSWTEPVEIPGLWVHDGPAGEGAFDCAGGVAGGWGMGCGTAGGGRFLPGTGASPTKDLDDGLTSVCQAPPDAFGVGGDGCVDDVEIWARPTRCMTDAGSMLGDGELGQWADAAPEDGRICWGVHGPEGTMVADHDDYPPGGEAPSLKATNPELGNDIWALIVNQQDLTFIAGRAYELGFWAKAAEPRAIRVFVQTRDLTHAFYWEDVQLGTTWTWYALGFVADQTSYDAMIDFQLAELSTAAVWLDGIALSDEGESPCARSGDQLVADGGFDAGRTCWRFGHDAQAAAASAWPDPDDAPTSAPSMQVSQAMASDPWGATLRQDGLTLAANRHYRLTFKARAASARTIEALVQVKEDWSLNFSLQRRIGTQWLGHTLDFVTPEASTPGGAHLHFLLGGAAGADVWLDDVSLVDVGPSPCVPGDGNLLADGGFQSGLACWQFGWNRDARDAYAEPDAAAPSGQAPSLLVAHDPGTDQVHEVSLKQPGKTIVAGRWYRLGYWARASAPRTIRAAVWDQDEAFAYYEDAVDGTWRYFEHDFRTTSGSTDAAVEFHLAAPGGAAVWLDGVLLQDRGADPCATPDAGSLLADGGFEAAALCWGFGFNAELTTATATPDADVPAGGDAPSLKVTQSPPPPNVWEVGIGQGGLTIRADRWYRLSFRARAAAARPIALAVWEEGTTYVYRTPTIDTVWQSYTFDFAPDVGGAAGAASVAFQLADASGATVWLDDVRLEDLGASPCVTSGDELVEDGELTAGLLCWFEPGPQGRFEVSSDHPPATSAPSLAITNLVEANELWSVQLLQRGFPMVQGAPYRLRFWAKAAAPRTIAAMVQNWDTQTMHTYHVVDVGTAWAEYTFDFEGANTEENALVELQFGQVSTATVWVDGVSLTKR
ncbi:MAG: carbohydrate binding domain-containing protein [Deltaproteobacteria bacterium]|nr:carbohydrate binding domain-containing protein [Deltaproteobacteria bacterium]